MNSKYQTSRKKKEKGSATLLVTVILLALITLVTVYITKLGLLEVKTGANANRAKEALHHAQAGLDYGAIRYLDEGDSFTAGSVAVAGTTVNVTAATSGGIYTITANGVSLDNTGAAQVQESYGRFPVADFGKLPPLMTNANFEPSGSFSIVTNPDGGGTGVPVSAWVESSTSTFTGSWDSCNYDEFYYQGGNAADVKTEPVDGFIRCDTCDCASAPTLCSATPGMNPEDCDDVVADPGIPDVFENTFGVDSAGWESYRDSVAVQYDSCSGFDDTTGDMFQSGGEYAGQIPLIWVTGDCPKADFSSAEIGSPDAPFILVVHGDLEFPANTVLFGIFMSFSDKYTDDGNGESSEDFELKLNGNTIVYGAILSNQNVDLPNGTLNLVYAKGVLENLGNAFDGEEYLIGRRTGSWNDIN